MTRFNVYINPQVLKWAREEAGFDLAEISKKINISIDEYEKREKEGENVRFWKT